MTELRPAALDPREASELLASARGGMSRDERESVVAMAAGNPLALLELGAGGTAPGGSRAVELAFFAQFARLPDATQQLLVVAACADSPDLGTVLAAARELGLEAGELAPAETAALISVDAGGLRFRHPLVRSAIHRAAPFAQRRAAHLALAAALDVEEDADRCAWHLAAAASGVDESVAAQLEASAVRARTRGGHAAGSAALERAAELTAEGHDRTRRLLAAADDALLAGRAGRALALLDRAGPMSDPLMRADAALVRGRAVFAEGRPADAQRLAADAAREIAETDPARALVLLGDVLEAGANGGSLAEAARIGGALADQMDDRGRRRRPGVHARIPSRDARVLARRLHCTRGGACRHRPCRGLARSAHARPRVGRRDLRGRGSARIRPRHARRRACSRARRAGDAAVRALPPGALRGLGRAPARWRIGRERGARADPGQRSRHFGVHGMQHPGGGCGVTRA